MEVRAKKSLGQHFLTDQDIARRIVDALQGSPVLEVGPGMGVLTQYLIPRLADGASSGGSTDALRSEAGSASPDSSLRSAPPTCSASGPLPLTSRGWLRFSGGYLTARANQPSLRRGRGIWTCPGGWCLGDPGEWGPEAARRAASSRGGTLRRHP